MNTITLLLGRINTLDVSLLDKIQSIDLLRESLHELDQMVEMKEAKEAIVLQLKYILMKIFDSDEEIKLDTIFDDQMLHTVIYGPPGTGKSQLGKILANFYSSLGILKRPSPKLDDDIKINRALSRAHRKYIFSKELTNLRLLNCNHNILDIQYKIHYMDPQPETDDIYNMIWNHYNELQEIISSNVYTPPEPDLAPLFKVVSRVDFVAHYVGQSAIKTMKLLEENVGRVLFIDEAYTLVLDGKDSFGMEVLTTLNLFMSERPHDVVIIFAGYKDLLEKTIFKMQPGLRRRCSWVFDVKPYTPEGLASIFRSQLKKYEWIVHESIDLNKFFAQNQKDFPNYGGDTHKLAFYCKLHYHDEEFIKIGTTNKRKRNPGPNIVTQPILKKALESLQVNRVQEKQIVETSVPFGMYG